MHSIVWLLSATTLLEPRRCPLRRFNAASKGMTTSDTAARAMPTVLEVRFALAGEIEHGLHRHVARQGEEAHRDKPQGLVLAVLGNVARHLPDDDRSR